MNQDATSYGGRPRPRRHCVFRWGPSSPQRTQPPPNFQPLSVVAKWLDGSWCHLYGGRPWPRPHCVRWGPSFPPPKRGTAAPSFRPLSVVAKRLPISATTEHLLQNILFKKIPGQCPVHWTQSTNSWTVQANSEQLVCLLKCFFIILYVKFFLLNRTHYINDHRRYFVSMLFHQEIYRLWSKPIICVSIKLSASPSSYSSRAVPVNFNNQGSYYAKYQHFTFSSFTVLNELKKCLIAVWSDFLQDIIDNAIDQYRKHLPACIRANGGYFEHLLWTNLQTICIFHAFLV